MKVIVNTDKNVTLTEESMDAMKSEVESTLRYFESDLTRVEVHLSDESAGRSTGNDIRCNLEARPEGRNPEFVANNADTVEEALSGALQKMIQVLDSSFGRLDTRKGGSSMGGTEPR